MKTTLVSKEKVKQEWYAVDATGQVVGRLATEIATILMGKHKADYTPYVDCGDFVVVTNCEKVVFSGKKWQDKVYRHHTRYLGGLVEEQALKVRELHPERIIALAVRRMLPKSALGKHMFKKLKVYAGAEHPHAAQQPKTLEIDARRK